MAPLDSEDLSIYSTTLYQGVEVPTVVNQWISRIVGAGGLILAWGGVLDMGKVVEWEKLLKAN